MGASTYRSSYSGKGSTSVSKGKGSTRRNNRVKESKSQMEVMLELLEKVERCRKVVANRQTALNTAEGDLKKAEQEVSKLMDELDPEIKARLIRMMGGFDKSDDQGR